MSTVARRNFLEALAGLGAAAIAGPGRAMERLGFANSERRLVAYPGKRPLLELTQRPPQLETPFSVFGEGPITPNDAFFVRYHLAGSPPIIDPATYRLQVTGAVAARLELSLDDLRRLPARQLVAVNQCSGNSRGFSDPRVGGGQLGNGAMGNARWRGVPLRAVLAQAGVKAEARAVEFGGADESPAPTIPDYVKALTIQHAADEDVLLAYEMNGEPLPLLNGYPLRLVVPGHYGTYWVKHLTSINVLEAESRNFWMQNAYRIPDNDCACTPRGQAATATRPIGKLNVRSFITNLSDGQVVKAVGRVTVRGIAFDGGAGIEKVELSVDDGVHWSQAKLGRDHGRYAFREWRISVELPAGRNVLLARATSHAGERQPMVAAWNPSGYMRNVVERVAIEVA